MGDGRLEMSGRNERRDGGGSRLLGVGLLGGLVALAIAWFGNCIPGFGGGGAPGSPSLSQPEQKAAPAPAPAPAPAEGGLRIVVDGERCRRADAPAEACTKLCGALASEAKTTRIEIEGTLGTHAAVDGLRKCLAEAGFRDVVVRAE